MELTVMNPSTCLASFMMAFWLCGCGQKETRNDPGGPEGLSTSGKQGPGAGSESNASKGGPPTRATPGGSTPSSDPQAAKTKRKLADFAGKWKSDRYELNLKPDGTGGGIFDEPGGFTAEQASIEEKDGEFVLSCFR